MTINWEVIIWTCITLAVLMSIIGLILYAISAKNVRSKRKELGEVHTELKVGSRIMFAGGVYGKVVSIDDEDTLRVEVAPKVVITISRYAVQVGDLKVGALVAVNAVGDVYDFETGRKVAGLRADDGKTFLDSERVLMQQLDAPQEKFVGNTTLGILFTNAKLDKARLCKAAGMAHDGYARAIRPVHTSMDGDSIYAVSLGDVPADLDAVGVIGARVMAKAIVRAVEAADSAYGFPAARDL